MSQDEGTADEAVELTEGSEATQNDGVEDNSHSESKKNQSNFKKLARDRKRLRDENERLKAQLARSKPVDDAEDDSEDDEDLDDSDYVDTDRLFRNTDARFFFIENKDASQYKEKMAELVEDNPARAKLPLEDLLELAKARYPKSTSKKAFDLSSVRSGSTSKEDMSKIDTSKMSEEEILALPPAVYKQLFKKK
jgi:hypothetical protein